MQMCLLMSETDNLIRSNHIIGDKFFITPLYAINIDYKKQD